MAGGAQAWTTFDLAEGFQLAHAVRVLHEAGVLASLRRPMTAAAAAARHGLDASLLGAVLAYVSARTDVVERKGKRYASTAAYGGSAAFLLDQYVGAYGPNAAALGRLLRDPSRAGAVVDRAAHARAFEGLEGPGLPALPGILSGLGLGRILDVGCGPASLLVELARRDPAFTGWGVDLSAPMCRAARRRIRAAGVADRVRVFRGDCRDLGAVLPARVRVEVQAVTAGSLLNEMFATGPEPAVAWLDAMRTLLPGRILVIVDYYGRLGQPGVLPRRAGLHDYVQAISGQGVPPPSLRAWKKIYTRAGCALLHAIEDHEGACFVHLLRL